MFKALIYVLTVLASQEEEKKGDEVSPTSREGVETRENAEGTTNKPSTSKEESKEAKEEAKEETKEESSGDVETKRKPSSFRPYHDDDDRFYDSNIEFG